MGLAGPSGRTGPPGLPGKQGTPGNDGKGIKGDRVSFFSIETQAPLTSNSSKCSIFEKMLRVVVVVEVKKGHAVIRVHQDLMHLFKSVAWQSHE